MLNLLTSTCNTPRLRLYPVAATLRTASIHDSQILTVRSGRDTAILRSTSLSPTTAGTEPSVRVLADFKADLLISQVTLTRNPCFLRNFHNFSQYSACLSVIFRTTACLVPTSWEMPFIMFDQNSDKTLKDPKIARCNITRRLTSCYLPHILRTKTAGHGKINLNGTALLDSPMQSFERNSIFGP